MTDQPTAAAPELAEASEPEPDPTTEATAEPGTEDVASLRREAATYRRRLRDTEAERDGLREQVDRRDRADAERLAGESMAAGGDLWHDVELADLRGEDGALSPELVGAAVSKVLADHPHWRRVRSASFDGGARTTPDMTPEHPFGAALKQAGRSA